MDELLVLLVVLFIFLDEISVVRSSRFGAFHPESAA
jgi:hypothetical protein